ncbi:MAG: glutamine--fructose-6-phosphate transaminase (isomerizing) [Candidatus Omnitrophica bacterium]|nr:glutamine--fructose-6-phosphate transaminase (isomerizing) [Candidatus Omnitrophota bacterium]
MCGIIGYIGDRDVSEVVIEGLTRLEYRGYDSAGVAILNDNGIDIRKRPGKLNILKADLKKNPIKGHIGLGHTRWATHGIPNEQNAHPHTDCKKNIVLVHNGIIENYQMLKDGLTKRGHAFRSQTDTEVIAHLIEENYKGNLEEAVRISVKELKGAYAIAVLHKDEPDKIVAARCESPLIVGIGQSEYFVASDIPAILKYTNKVIFINNYEIVSIDKKGVRVIDYSNQPIKKKAVCVDWDITQAEKGGYDHFMLKEIHEQPDLISNILNTRVRGNRIHFDELRIKDTILKKIDKIFIVACGTAYHAGLNGKYMIEWLAQVPTLVDTSSEFRYRNPIVGKNTLVVVISQSGETADTLAALRESKKKGAKVLGVVNVLGSSISREADGVIYTHAGPEIAVASTKAYTAQLAILYLFSLYLAGLREKRTPYKIAGYLKELKKAPGHIKKMLEQYGDAKKSDLKHKARIFNREYHKRLKDYYQRDSEGRKRAPNCCFLFLGRNVNYPSALEGALKLKEISYISAEGYPAGEMKHGPIALIDENPWTICIVPESSLHEKMISNIMEIKSRGGIVVAIATEGDEEIRKVGVDYIIDIPRIEQTLTPFLVAIPLQLLAYFVAREFGEDIDQPRNLAKSVTVE